MNHLIPFKVDHIDPLGQGVSKQDGQVIFIPKTLPQEQGLCLPVSSKGKVQFAIVKKITVPSPLRLTPECPHYNQCNSCHYLHCAYQNEIDFKVQSFQRYLSQLKSTDDSLSELNWKSPHILAANERFGYRNRLQLHYQNLKNEGTIIGQYKYKSKDLLPIPQCLLPEASISKALKNLYMSNIKLPRPQGHLEIQSQDQDQVKIVWDRPYSDGGFRQVNVTMNQKLKTTLGQALDNLDPKGDMTILDLFGGNGNLSASGIQRKCLVIDSYQPDSCTHERQQFIPLDLYNPDDLSRLFKLKINPDIIIIDPPRSGMRQISQILDFFSPECFFYVSCSPDTLIRDTQTIMKNYRPVESWLFDFFPGTFHWESMLRFKKIKQ